MIEDKEKKQRGLETVVKTTADGSHTLFVPSLNEHYHSVNGAIQEAMHVFVDAGLKQCIKDEISVFEVGFGTGLNALLTAQYAEDCSKKICYISIEAFPLASSLIQELNYAPESEDKLYKQLHQVEWNCQQKITDHFSLTKIENDFTQFDFTQLAHQFDVIYFDAFAPDVQNGMWTQELFDSMYLICRENAILTTYCAKGVVRRRMQQAGFTVERIAGPMGKREMLRARKN